MGDVKPIKNDRVNLTKARAKTTDTPKAVKPGENSNQAIHDIDENHPAVESYFDAGLQRKLKARLRSGDIRPNSRIDLHGMRLQQARQALDDFLGSAIRQQQRMILVIHGQGYGSREQAVLKPMVQRRLAERANELLAWCPAQPRDGAGGATYVYLKRN